MLATLLALSLAAEPFPFDATEIAKDLAIGYAVHLADVNGDGKRDIVVVDQKRVVWYENPTWKVRTIVGPKTKPDNVCLASHDIDGDGKLDFVLGAAWKPADTTTPGTLHWLARGKSIDDEWTLHDIPCDEPTVHRVKVLTLAGQPKIVVVPLQGRGATAKGNWLDGRPVRIVTYAIPRDPTKPTNWKAEVFDESLHVVHNFLGRDGELYAASYEGVTKFGSGKPVKIGDGDQFTPAGSRGSSEIAMAVNFPGPFKPIATVEPWHGNSIVVYPKIGERRVIDNELRWGHAIAFADLDGDGLDEIIAGVRDNPDPKKGDAFAPKRGVRVYKFANDGWVRTLVDPDGVAVEDLAVGDLDGDGRLEIVAVGRATRNCKIYWNRTGK
jgi:hypothetical protein